MRVSLDTTAVIDLCFWDQEQILKVRSALPPGEHDLWVSDYVLFELARGYLRYLILLHSKTMVLDRLSDVIRFQGNLHHQPYYAGAVRGAIEVFMRDAKERIGLDVQQEMLFFRARLSQSIKRGWKKANSFNKTPFNPVGCLKVSSPKLDDQGFYKQERPNTCGNFSACGVKPYFAKNSKSFASLRSSLQSLPKADAETIRRIKALRILYRVPNRDFVPSDCYSCGDAIICHEALDGNSTLLSKNAKHMTPIASILGAKVITYSV